MDKNDATLPSPEQALEKYQTTPQGENLIQTVEALVQLVPVVGGILGTYIGDSLNQTYQKRLDTLLQSLVHDLSHTQRKMNTEFVKSDDLPELFGEIIPRVQKERNKEKRHYYKNILRGAILNKDIDPYDTSMKYVRTLEDLQPVHIAVLRAVAIELPDEELLRRDRSAGGFMMNTLNERLPEIPKSQFPEILEDLNLARVTNFRVGSLMLGMNGSSAANLRARMTEYGIAFVEFVLEG